MAHLNGSKSLKQRRLHRLALLSNQQTQETIGSVKGCADENAAWKAWNYVQYIDKYAHTCNLLSLGPLCSKIIVRQKLRLCVFPQRTFHFHKSCCHHSSSSSSTMLFEVEHWYQQKFSCKSIKIVGPLETLEMIQDHKGSTAISTP